MILVVGATGKVGSRVVGELAAAGARVRCLVRDAKRARGVLPASAEQVEGDLDDAASLAAAMAGAEALFLSSPIEPAMAARQGAAVAAAVAAGVGRIVKLSGSAWTMDPARPTRAGTAHRKVEAAIAASGIDAVCVRPNAFTQQILGRVVDELRRGPEFTLAIGAAAVSFTDIRDVASACAAALRGGSVAGPVLEVTGPVAVGGDDLAAALAALLRRPVAYRAIGIDDSVARARAGGASEFTLAHQREVLALIAEGAAAAVTDTFAALCGRPPRPPMAWLTDVLVARA